jgi:hypothetical protein
VHSLVSLHRAAVVSFAGKSDVRRLEVMTVTRAKFLATMLSLAISAEAMAQSASYTFVRCEIGIEEEDDLSYFRIGTDRVDLLSNSSWNAFIPCKSIDNSVFTEIINCSIQTGAISWDSEFNGKRSDRWRVTKIEIDRIEGSIEVFRSANGNESTRQGKCARLDRDPLSATAF